MTRVPMNAPGRVETSKRTTPSGLPPKEPTLTRNLEASIRETARILRVAADGGKDVHMLGGSLTNSLLDDLFRAVVGVSFGELARGILKSGGTMQMIVYNHMSDDQPMSTSLRQLAAEVEPGSATGRRVLEIYYTNIIATASAPVSHFLIARGPGADDPWVTRIEKPHPIFAPASFVNGQGLALTAVTFEGAAARVQGGPLFIAFEKVLRAAREAASRSSH